MGKASGSAGRGDKTPPFAEKASLEPPRPKGGDKIDGWLDKGAMAYIEQRNFDTFYFQWEDGEAQRGVTKEKLDKIEKEIKAKYKDVKSDSGHATVLPPTTLNAEQDRIVNWYIGNGAKHINRDLREGTLSKFDAEDLRKLDSAFEPLKHDVVVYRGAARFSKKDKAYLSTSTSIESAYTFARNTEGRKGKVQAMLLPKGTMVLVPKEHGAKGYEEREVILPRGTDTSKFKTKIVADLNFKNNVHKWKL